MTTHDLRIAASQRAPSQAGRARVWQRAALTVVVVALCACNHGSETGDGQPQAASAQSSVVSVVADPFPALARAVYDTRAEQPVDLRFEWSTIPVAGQSFQLNLTWLGLVDVTALQWQVSAPEGVTLASGGSGAWEALKTGESQNSVIEARVTANGLYVLGVSLQATTAVGELTYKYSIPLAVTVAESSSPSLSSSSGKSGA